MVRKYWRGNILEVLIIVLYWDVLDVGLELKIHIALISQNYYNYIFTLNSIELLLCIFLQLFIIIVIIIYKSQNNYFSESDRLGGSLKFGSSVSVLHNQSYVVS
jgi:hypothetical protein